MAHCAGLVILCLPAIRLSFGVDTVPNSLRRFGSILRENHKANADGHRKYSGS